MYLSLRDIFRLCGEPQIEPIEFLLRTPNCSLCAANNDLFRVCGEPQIEPIGFLLPTLKFFVAQRTTTYFPILPCAEQNEHYRISVSIKSFRCAASNGFLSSFQADLSAQQLILQRTPSSRKKRRAFLPCQRTPIKAWTD